MPSFRRFRNYEDHFDRGDAGKKESAVDPPHTKKRAVPEPQNAVEREQAELDDLRDS